MFYPETNLVYSTEEYAGLSPIRIVEILARATGGVGVILEHRYYGKWL